MLRAFILGLVLLNAVIAAPVVYAAAPTITASGTAATAGSDTLDLALTIPADCTVLAVGFGGFEAVTVSVDSVQGDPTGTPFDLNDLTLFGQRTNAQYAGLYAIYDTNVNWPGTGSVTVRIDINRTSAQLKGQIFCVADVDTGGTATNDTDITAESASGTPSVTLTSTSNALNVAATATYSADTTGGGDDTSIGSIQNGGSSSSLYVWAESGTGASDTIESSGTVAYKMVAVSFEGTSGGGGNTPLRRRRTD